MTCNTSCHVNMYIWNTISEKIDEVISFLKQKYVASPIICLLFSRFCDERQF